MESVAIRIDNVSKVFQHQVKGQVYAARDVSLDVGAGEFVTLLGPSGCGKTTILRMVAGFGLPDMGKVFIGGQDVTTLPANQRNIGFVFQNYALFPHLSIFENVAYGLQVRKLPGDEIARAVGDVLSLVGLTGYERQFPAQLSGGEQQRVALARAIVIRPRVLLFDEPLSNLDARLRIQMRHEIRELQKRLSITTLYVTHDQEEAMAVSDRIAVMSKGAIAQVGTAEDLYYRPGSEFVARFVGKVNLVPGHLARVDERGAEVDVLGQRIPVRVVPAGLRGGDPVNVVLRPEAIGLEGAAGARDHASVHPATVTSRTFLGEKIEYLVECAGETLQIASQSSGARAASLIEGQRVRLLLPENAALLPVGGP
jgi:iron(III) transport system ATP-binding protein